MFTGLFIGLTTLDFIYLSDRSLTSNQKIAAQDYLTVGGGPATNAAVAFNYFGNQSQLISVLGQHPLTQLIRNDLREYGVEMIDLMPQKTDPPCISSIIVNSNTGERAVISLNAAKSQAELVITPDLLSKVDIILIDGHQLAVSLAIAQLAQTRNIPVVMDGGSWKPGLEKILPYIDYAICSANFYPPQCQTTNDVFNWLQEQGIEKIAITNGENPIQHLAQNTKLGIKIPPTKTIDTLGAGDIFHGAFCHYILQADFATALLNAAKVASKSCQYFGTRRWLREN